MIDHISLRVNDFEKAVAFYKAALSPLGYKVLMEFPGAVGFGSHKADFWVTKSDLAPNPTHIAFSTDRKTVNAFHKEALEAGGKDNGAPGPRTEYHPNYYGAFVLDPEGNNVEAVCHEAEGVAAKKPRAAGARSAKAAPRKKAAVKAKKAKAPAKKAKGSAKKAKASVKKAKAAPKAKTASKAKAAKGRTVSKTAGKRKGKAASKAKSAPKAKAASKAKAGKAKPAGKAKAKTASRRKK